MYQPLALRPGWGANGFLTIIDSIGKIGAG